MFELLLSVVYGVVGVVQAFVRTLTTIFWLINNLPDILKEMLAASVVEEAAQTVMIHISGVVASLYEKTLLHWNQLMITLQEVLAVMASLYEKTLFYWNQLMIILPKVWVTLQRIYLVSYNAFVIMHSWFDFICREAASIYSVVASVYSVVASGVSQVVRVCLVMISGVVGVVSFIRDTLVSITSTSSSVLVKTLNTISDVIFSIKEKSQSLFECTTSYITFPVITITLTLLVLIFLTVWVYRNRHWLPVLMNMQQVFQNCFMVAQPYINPAHPQINPAQPQINPAHPPAQPYINPAQPQINPAHPHINPAQPQRDDDVAANDGRPGSAVEGERVAVDSAAQGAGGCGGERQRRRRSNSPNLPRESQPPLVSRSSSQSAGSVRMDQGDEADTGSQSPSPPPAQRVSEDTGMRQRRERRDSSPNLSRDTRQPPSMRRGSSPSVGGRGRQPDQGNQASTNRPSPPLPAALTIDNHAYGHVRQRRQYNDTNLSRDILPQYRPPSGQTGVHRPPPPPSPSPSSPSSPPASPAEEDRLCIVCMDSQREVLLRPCSHYHVCLACCKQLRGVCPVCTRKFTEIIRVYD